MKHKLTAATLVLAIGPLVAFPAQADDEPKSLYERLGGLQSISPMVEDFVNHLVFNPTLNRNPVLNASRRHTPPSYLKYQFTQLVCEMSGGPCVYSGLSTDDAREPLKITPQEWEVVTAELKKSLEKFKVQPQEQTELLELFARTKDDILVNIEVTKDR